MTLLRPKRVIASLGEKRMGYTNLFANSIVPAAPVLLDITVVDGPRAVRTPPP